MKIEKNLGFVFTITGWRHFKSAHTQKYRIILLPHTQKYRIILLPHTQKYRII